MRRIALALVLLPISVLARAGEAEAPADKAIRRSVVRLCATQRYPDYIRPWSRGNPQTSSGTGVVIEGRRILTCAHLVAYASQIYVQPYGVSERIAAKVTAMAPAVDLAVLEVADEAFHKSHAPLAVCSELPKARAPVSVYGYPVGGFDISVTRGAVARVEAVQGLLRVDVDAAIGPGSSGGPAMAHGKMIGLVFGMSAAGRKMAHVVPMQEIALALQDVRDGKYDGKLQMWEFTQALENHALRAKLHLRKTLTGVLVREPAHTGPGHPLRQGDIITSIGPHNIDNWGMVRIRDDLRLPGGYLVHGLAKDGTVALTVVRDGKARSLDLPVSTKLGEPVIRNLWGDYPSYFVWGPLAFSPATAELVNVLSPYLSAQWNVQHSPLLLRQNGTEAFEGEQLVVVTGMFPHKTSKGYGSPIGRVVAKVNGTPIRNLKHLVASLRDVTDKYVEFEFAGKYAHMLVFGRQEVADSMEEILSDNGIRRRCSDDVRDVWHARKEEPTQRGGAALSPKGAAAATGSASNTSSSLKRRSLP